MRKQWLMILLVGGVFSMALLCSRGGAAPEDRIAPDAVPMHLEGAMIQAGDNELKLLEVPVGPMNGQREFRYVDIACKLSLLPDGTVRVDRAVATPSARIAQSVQHFIAGTYRSGGYTLTLSGPARSAGGREVWHTDRQNAAWCTGPVEGNPELPVVGIASSAGLPANFCYGHDATGHLIGTQSTATTLSMVWFKIGGDKVQPTYTVERSETWQRVISKE